MTENLVTAMLQANRKICGPHPYPHQHKLDWLPRPHLHSH